jgi:hypothetical protein
MMKGCFDPVGPWRCDGSVGTIVGGGCTVQDGGGSIVGWHSALIGLRGVCNNLPDDSGSIYACRRSGGIASGFFWKSRFE